MHYSCNDTPYPCYDAYKIFEYVISCSMATQKLTVLLIAVCIISDTQSIWNRMQSNIQITMPSTTSTMQSKFYPCCSISKKSHLKIKSCNFFSSYLIWIIVNFPSIPASWINFSGWLDLDWGETSFRTEHLRARSPVT